jgi:Fe2+ or Zn2+ uptake regulation protein
MSCVSDYAPQLRSRGYRVTPQRMAILHVLRHSGKHLSPREVYRKAKRDYPQLTVPTVYRTLEFLAKNGLAHPSRAVNGHITYEIASNDHHHIVCHRCGNTVEVNHATIESLYRKLESTTGYLQIDSHLTFMGICPDCQKTSKG